MGSIVAILGVCLPGGILMYAVGIFYHLHGDHTWTTAALKGVAAAAVGLLLSTVVSLSKKALSHKFDFVFMAATVIAVNRLHWSVPRALILIGILAILFHLSAENAERAQLKLCPCKTLLKRVFQRPLKACPFKAGYTNHETALAPLCQTHRTPA